MKLTQTNKENLCPCCGKYTLYLILKVIQTNTTEYVDNFNGYNSDYKCRNCGAEFKIEK